MHHVVVPVDPISDPSWRGLKSHISTDGVHKNDDTGPRSRESKEQNSEAVKILKGSAVLKEKVGLLLSFAFIPE